MSQKEGLWGGLHTWRSSGTGVLPSAGSWACEQRPAMREGQWGQFPPSHGCSSKAHLGNCQELWGHKEGEQPVRG